MRRITCLGLMLTALLFVLSTTKVCAEEQPINPIEVRGLIVSSVEGLMINDGQRDYLLLGVDDIGIEGKVCVVFGDLFQEEDHVVIDVYEVHLVAEEYPLDDNIGIRWDWHDLNRIA